MAREITALPRGAAALSGEQIARAIPALERRIAEFRAVAVDSLADGNGHALDGLVQKANATLRDVFGAGTIEYYEYEIESMNVCDVAVSASGDGDPRESFRDTSPDIRKLVAGAIRTLEAARGTLKGRLASERLAADRVLRAYEGLQLHPDIVRVASKRYQDGHFADAVEAAVKALNNLVRLRSGSDLDGTKLMESVFSVNSPALRFNMLADQSDKDEQKGFMMLFSGAVAGLRNPRAHKFIQDDPERALEFIAFVSLLAKLLDGANP